MHKGISCALTSDSTYMVHSTKISLDKPLDEITNELAKTGLPVIVSITHPTLSGHWIVVDKITATDVFIRDPNSGSAYQIPHKTMEDYLTSDETQESLISIRPRQQLGQSEGKSG